jgi:hypothetical protein
MLETRGLAHQPTIHGQDRVMGKVGSFQQIEDILGDLFPRTANDFDVAEPIATAAVAAGAGADGAFDADCVLRGADV